MKRRSKLKLIAILIALMLALFSFTSCDDSSITPPETDKEQTGSPGDEPSVRSDEKALTGQWLFYMSEETEFPYLRIGDFSTG